MTNVSSPTSVFVTALTETIVLSEDELLDALNSIFVPNAPTGRNDVLLNSRVVCAVADEVVLNAAVCVCKAVHVDPLSIE